MVHEYTGNNQNALEQRELTSRQIEEDRKLAENLARVEGQQQYYQNAQNYISAASNRLDTSNV